jgi:hypothetical protein
MSQLAQNLLIPLDGQPPAQHLRPIPCVPEERSTEKDVRTKRLIVACKQSVRLSRPRPHLLKTLRSVGQKLRDKVSSLRHALESDSNFFMVDAVALRRLGWAFGLTASSSTGKRSLFIQFHPGSLIILLLFSLAESYAYRATVKRNHVENGLDVAFDAAFSQSLQLHWALMDANDNTIWTGTISSSASLPQLNRRRDVFGDMEHDDADRIMALHTCLLNAKSTAEAIILFSKVMS